MTIRFRLLFVALVAAPNLARHLEGADEAGPTLRQTNYLAVLPEPGRQAEVVLKTQQYSPAYSDVLHFFLIGPDGSTVSTSEVSPGEAFRLSLPAAARGLHVLELASGWNACRADTGATPKPQPSAEAADSCSGRIRD